MRGFALADFSRVCAFLSHSAVEEYPFNILIIIGFAHWFHRLVALCDIRILNSSESTYLIGVPILKLSSQLVVVLETRLLGSVIDSDLINSLEKSNAVIRERHIELFI